MEPPGSSQRPNVFHLISFSEGFDLSPLFVGSERHEEGIRFATREPASYVISRVALDAAMILLHCASTSPMTCSGGRFRLRLDGEERGRKGKLTVAANIFTMAPSMLVVAVRRDGGDAVVEYKRFYSDELRPCTQGHHVDFVFRRPNRHVDKI
ncbi:CBL-interacting protein kinase 6-like [Canna indica]|uniref:CBL-interacting protein kinase 6-like n=1 Tax=Canna indica TaxID=4628 RepID=A0AAQ3Q329_9LILI|nr:CBL-interacting protein kinase 6-like [Canna indica]